MFVVREDGELLWEVDKGGVGTCCGSDEEIENGERAKQILVA